VGGKRFIGRHVRSKEGPRHVTGGGRFTDDISFPGLLHAVIVRSPYAHARIRSVDASAALEMPGVVAVLGPGEVKSLSKPFKPGRYAAGLRVTILEYATAVEKVRYVGEPVAMVAARSRGQAEDAAEAITVDYEPLPPVTDAKSAVGPDASFLYDELGTNMPWEGVVSYGDVEKAFQEADRVISHRLKIHRYSSTPLEPFACIAKYERATGHLTTWCNAQSPEVIYEALTQSLELENVRLLIPDIGGGFGQKIHLIRKYALLTSLMAVRTGRPVKWIEDRSEHMMAGGHSCDQEFEVEAAFRKDGEVSGLKIRDTDDVGGSVSTLTIHFTNKLNNLFNTYLVQNLRLEGRSVVTNKCPVVPNRGIGKPGMCFVWERTMDRIAQDLGLDPVEVRLRNLIPPDRFPYTTPNGNIYSSGEYETLLQKALAKIDYAALRAQQKRERKEGRLLGIGVVIGLEPGGRNAARDMAIFPESKNIPGAGGVEGVTIKLEKNGRVAISLGSPSCGQAHETTAAQIAADVLGVSPEHVAVASPFDTAVSPWGVSSTNSGNNFHLYDVGAIHGGASRLREKILTLAAHLLNVERETLVIEDGIVSDSTSGDKKIPFAELGKIAYGNQSLLPEGFEPGLQTTYYHSFSHADPMMVPDDKGRVRAQYTFSAAAHAAVVEVEPSTGRARVLRYVIVSDNGTILNPDVVDGQIYGSVAHGISVALGEGFVYDDEGQLMTLTLLDYGKSTTLETPAVEIEHHSVPCPFTTLGQKAAGEGAAIPSPAAIASAVEDALQPFGARVEELPLSPENVWNLIQEARAH
jgi:2-furoyl-CoA dehydrogenase large subunit